MKKTILITGASSGIGKATAKVFADNAWNVIATMRDPEGEKQLNHLKNILVTGMDVEKTETINKAIETGIRQFNKIDVLLNNAGIGLFGPFETTPEESVRRMFEVNLFGVMRVTKAVLPHFRAHQEGTIVNVSSGTGLFTLPLLSLYSATKYALEGFSESLSFELSAHNIKVKLIEPGKVATRFDDTTRKNHLTEQNITAYQDYLEKTIELYSKADPSEIKASAEDVARVIYHAVTDNSDTLRYIIGDNIKAMASMKASLSDQEFIELMRKRFVYDSPL